MKTEPRKFNVTGILLLALFALALLAACSGGNIDVAVGEVNLPPGSLPPFTNSEPVVAQGTITGFGDLTVNGVRYDTRGASIVVDSQPGVLSDLKAGHVVMLSGRIGGLGLTGEASTVHMHSLVTGPVDSVDVGNGRLMAMGQTVQIGPDTQYSVDIDPATMEGLAAGDHARISGYFDAAGNIRATRIETAAADAPLQVTGEVRDHDIANLLFDINRLLVDYGSAILIDLPGGAPSNGMTVRVIGTLSDALLVAERLQSGPALPDSTGERVQIGGIITRFASTADFEVNGIAVGTTPASTFSNGNSGDLRLNARVTIDGEFDTGSRILAARITFGETWP